MIYLLQLLMKQDLSSIIECWLIALPSDIQYVCKAREKFMSSI